MVAEVGDTSILVMYYFVVIIIDVIVLFVEMEFDGLCIDNDENSSENDGDESDGDTVSETELRQAFNKPYKLVEEKAVTLSRNYILHMSCTRLDTG